MGYTETTTKDASKVWCNAIYHFSDKDCENYMIQNSLDRNPVKDKICISGECLCGSFGSNEELAEIRSAFPEAAAEIDRLDKISTENGHPWGWGSGPNEWYKNHPKGVLNMFDDQPMFMCVGCEQKRELISQNQ